MADLCLPLSAGEDRFELHSVQLELEVQLRKRKATLETSRADAHKSRVSMQHAANTPTTSNPCVSLHRPHAPGTRSSQMSFTLALENPGPWVQQQKTRSWPRSTTSPPPVFEISSRNRFAPLCETDQYIVIFSMLLRKQDTGLTHSKYLCLMLHCQICKINLSYLLLWLLCIDRQGHIQIFKMNLQICSQTYWLMLIKH